MPLNELCLGGAQSLVLVPLEMPAVSPTGPGGFPRYYKPAGCEGGPVRQLHQYAEPDGAHQPALQNHRHHARAADVRTLLELLRHVIDMQALIPQLLCMPQP